MGGKNNKGASANKAKANMGANNNVMTIAANATDSEVRKVSPVKVFQEIH